MHYDFQERLLFSQAIVGESAVDIIRRMIPGCVKVEKTNIKMDKSGVDYIATLRGGSIINIDHKARDKGCSLHWENGPEIALEIWSVMPINGHMGKTGWTLDESKSTDYTLHTFHLNDSKMVYLLPFQLLRKSFRNHFHIWREKYKTAIQNSGEWQSQCIFVPINEIEQAIICSQKYIQYT